VYHDSMVHHWNDWYMAYVNATFPRVMIRFEDLIFHPVNVTRTICHCFGGVLDSDSDRDNNDTDTDTDDLEGIINNDTSSANNNNNNSIIQTTTRHHYRRVTTRKERRHPHTKNSKFVYIVDSAKKGAAHGKDKTGFVDAIIRYGTNKPELRWQHMLPQDRIYAQQHLHPMLMNIFRYQYPP
jgi:hypothetical protein